MRIDVEHRERVSDSGEHSDYVRSSFIDDDGGCQWEVECVTYANPTRAFYCVLSFGWVVWEVTARPDMGHCRATCRQRETIPPHVLSHIPKLTSP